MDSASSPGHSNILVIDHGDGTWSTYFHMPRNGVVVEPGDRVPRGELVAFSSASGTGTPHVHVHVKPCLETSVFCFSEPFQLANADPRPEPRRCPGTLPRRGRASAASGDARELPRGLSPPTVVPSSNVETPQPPRFQRTRSGRSPAQGETMNESRENIHELLTRNPLSEGDLKHFAELIADIEGDRRLGVRPTDVFPLGTIDPDALVARFSSPQSGVAELVRRILAASNEKKVNLEIFPKGMFPPFEFDVQATFGRAPQA